MHTFVIINQKGGCGKTTTAISLAGIFASRGKRTLLVDLDPQSHCAAGLAIPEQRIDLDVGDAMLSDTPVEKSRLVWRVSRGLDLIPSRLKLAGLEAARGGLASKPDKERRLGRVLETFKDEYDVVLVDCSPSVGLLTYNALACATTVVVPVETSFFSLQGATKQVNTIKSLERRLGVSAPYRILPTIHEPVSALAEDLIGELRRRFDGHVCPFAVRRDAKLKEAASFGQPVSAYAPDSDGTLDYTRAAEWLLPSLARPETPSALTSPRTATTTNVATETTTKPVPGAVEPKGASGRVTREIAPTNAPIHGTGHGTGHETTGGPTAPLITTPPTLEPAGAPAAAPVGVPSMSAVRLVTEEDGIEPAREAVLGTIVLAPERAKAVRVAAATDTATTESTTTETKTTETAFVETQAKPVEAPKTRTEPSIDRPGVYVDGDGAWFVQTLHAGRTVAVAGDFNHWSSSTHVMERDERLGVQRLRVPMIAGRYRYRLVIDGRWCCDPTNPLREPNEFGDFNSLVVVEA